MNDRIEIEKAFNSKGEEVIKFYVHCDLGRLYLHEWPFRIGVFRHFKGNVSAAELREHKYGNDKKLNKIVDRLPAYIKYAKEYALEEAAYYDDEYLYA